MKTGSINKRYLSKISNRILQIFLGFLTIGVVPRVLGSGNYGDFGFLNNLFSNLIKFLHLGFPTALSIKISKRQSKKILTFIFFFIFICLLISKN